MMYRSYFTPVNQDFTDLHKEMNRLFSSYLSNRPQTAQSFPALNIWVNEDEAQVTAEIPGVSLDELEISVINNTLTLKGDRKEEDIPDGASCYRQERGTGLFTRSLELPFKVDSEHVEAVFQKGVLKVTLPRAEEDKPKKISVKAA